MSSMKTLVLQEPFHFVYEDRPVPDCPPDHALVKVNAVAVCGSDIHAFSGNQPLLTYPRVLGHEICGTVVEVNGDAGYVPGDKVCAMPYLYCGNCVSCRQNRTNCCVALKVLGVHTDGGMCGYISLPSQNFIKVPANMDDKVVSLIEPFSVSAHGIKRGQVGSGDRVLVVGAGPIGLGAAEIAKSCGAMVIMADTSEVRTAFARDGFGYRVLNPLDEKYLDSVKDEFGEPPNKVIDSTGNRASMSNAVNCMGYGGTIVFLGLQKDTLDISNPALHVKEGTIYASRVSQEEDFAFVLRQVQDGKLHPEKFITHTSTLDAAKNDLENWIKKGSEVFKGVIKVDSY